MKEFYMPIKEDNKRNNTNSILPKIFGMTASPTNNNKDQTTSNRYIYSFVYIKISQLEQNLDCRIHTIDHEDYQNHSLNFKKPKEITVTYSENFHSNKTIDIIDKLSKECIGSESIEKILKTSNRILFEQGALCAYHYVKYSVNMLISTKDEFTELLKSIIENQKSLIKPNVLTESGEIDEYPIIQKAIDIVNSDTNKEYESIKLIRKNSKLYSPKIYELLKFLKSYRAKANIFRCILFVETKASAISLYQIIKRTKDIEFIRPEFLLGHNLRLRIKMDYKSQNKIISKFNNSEINMIIATKVAEEGLDLPKCNLIIRFDTFKCVISYIQSRGRARHEDSLYVIFEPIGNNNYSNQNDTLYELQSKEKTLKSWCSLPPEKRPNSIINTEVNNEEELVLRNEKTNAIITLDSCISLLYYFCSLLPKDSFSSTNPIYEYQDTTEFCSCKMTLPNSFPFKNRIFIAASNYGKLQAKRKVCFKACKLLSELNLFDDNFLPISHQHLKEIKTYFSSFKIILQNRLNYIVYTPKFWNSFISGHGYIYSITSGICSFNYKIKLGFIFPNMIYNADQINIIAQHFKNIDLNLKFVKREKLNKAQIDLLYSFTREIFKILLRKKLRLKYETQQKFLVIPLNANNVIDYSALSEYIDNQNKTYREHIKQEDFITNILYPKHIFKVMEVCTKMSLHSIIPTNKADETETFIERITRIKHKNFYKISDLDLNQNIIKCIKISSRLNYLNSTTQHNREVEHKEYYLIPELSQKLFIPQELFNQSCYIPSILEKLNTFMINNEFMLDHKIPGLDQNLLSEAFMLPSANQDVNYQRLEFLGDSFLKIMGCFLLINEYSLYHEGLLALKKDFIVSNRSLSVLFGKQKLNIYINHKTFVKKKWIPIGYIQNNTNNPNNVNYFKLSLKQRADITESLLAAVLLSTNEQKALEFAFSFGFFENLKFRDFSNNIINDDFDLIEHSKSTKLEEFLNINDLQQILGYEFKYKKLLIEALTHPSHYQNVTCSYQRLEFLGDALLDYLLTRHIYNKYCSYSPAKLHEIKSAYVSNSSLALISIKSGLSKYLLHVSDNLPHKIIQYENRISELEYDSLLTFENWVILDYPKPLADIIESLLGAVFLDCKGDWNIVNQIFKKIVVDFLESKIDIHNISNPKFALYKRIHQQGCKDIEIKTRRTEEENIENSKSKNSYCCNILVHGIPIQSTISTTLQKATKKATREVFEKLKQKTISIEKICSCNSGGSDSVE